MKKLLLSIALTAVTVSATAQMTNQSVSPAFTRGFMLICKWDHNDAHRQVRLYGHGDYENADVKIIERHSEDIIYQTKLIKTDSESPSDQRELRAIFRSLGWVVRGIHLATAIGY